MSGDRGVAAAEAAAESIQADPGEARHRAETLLADPALSAEARIVARWALGLALRETGELEASESCFAEAIEAATAAGLLRRAALARVSLALTLANLGRFDDALGQTKLARPDVSGSDRARLDQQEALILQRRGDYDGARNLYGRALAGSADDPVLECRVLSNLGVLEGYAGQVDRGVQLLTEAMDRAAVIGQLLLEARAAHNLGFLEGRRGNVPAGLRWFDRARERYEALGAPGGDLIVLEADRSELLMDAGLHHDAAERSQVALDELAAGASSLDIAELRLLNARARLADGRPAEAAAGARLAAASFRSQRRETWRHVAEVFALECERQLDGGGRWQDAARTADQLSGAGVVNEGVRARLLAARLALDAGDGAAARQQLDRLPAIARIAIDADRAAAWLAVAQLRVVSSNRGGARRALRAGLRAVRSHQRRFGSFELRARAAAAGAGLAELGLRMALEDRRPQEMLVWLEASRAGALRLPPVRAPDDVELGDSLAELRMVESQMAGADRAGHAHGLGARHRELEALVRDRSHLVAGERGPPVEAATVDLAALDEALGDRVLLEYFSLDRQIHALTRSCGRTTHHALGEFAPVVDGVDHLRFAINRLARRPSSAASVRAAEAALDGTARELEARLLRPMRGVIRDADLVVVPTSALHNLPWLALPACRSAAAVVAPSAQVWLQAQTRALSRRTGARSLVVAGPDLAGAAAEAIAVGRILPTATVILGDEATVQVVGRELASAAIAHIASHGAFRRDNPLFSSFRLADGAFTVYELERVAAVPWLFVLPACHAAATSVYLGEELLGFGAALLALGAAAVVAPVTPVPDEATRDLMVEFHTALVAGHNPARALAGAASSAAEVSPRSRAAAASFVLVGAAGP